MLPSPSRARDVWPRAAPASPVPPPSRRGWERPEAAPGGRGPLSARPLRPRPALSRGWDPPRARGWGSPGSRSGASPCPCRSLLVCGREARARDRAPRAPPRRPQRSLGHQLPLPLGALSPSEITDAAGGWVGGVGGDILSLRVTWLQSWGIGETGQTSAVLASAPALNEGNQRGSRLQGVPIPVRGGGRGGAEHRLDDK